MLIQRFRRIPRNRSIILSLALVTAAFAFSACLDVSSSDGQIGLTGPTTAQFTIHGSLSQVLSNVLTSSCDWNFACFSNATANQPGNDYLSNEALTDCNPADQGYPLCGYDFTTAAYDRVLTCPGGAFCGGDNTEWESRCLAFSITDDNPISDLLNWNISDAYFNYGSWTWYNQGNGNCAG